MSILIIIFKNYPISHSTSDEGSSAKLTLSVLMQQQINVALFKNQQTNSNVNSPHGRKRRFDTCRIVPYFGKKTSVQQRPIHHPRRSTMSSCTYHCLWDRLTRVIPNSRNTNSDFGKLRRTAHFIKYARVIVSKVTTLNTRCGLYGVLPGTHDQTLSSKKFKTRSLKNLQNIVWRTQLSQPSALNYLMSPPKIGRKPSNHYVMRTSAGFLKGLKANRKGRGQYRGSGRRRESLLWVRTNSYMKVRWLTKSIYISTH